MGSRPSGEVARPAPTAAVFSAEIGESPDVAQANGIAHAGHEEVETALPRVPVREVRRLLLHFDHQGFGLVTARGNLANLRGDLSISHLAAIRRHVSEFGRRGPGRWTCDVGPGPRGQQFCGSRSPQNRRLVVTSNERGQGYGVAPK